MKYYNAAQAARKIGISDKTIRRWLVDGKISAIRTPSNLLAIPESEVEKFRRQRAQFVQEEGDMTSHNQIETLAARVTELEQEMARLKGESHLSEKAEKTPVSPTSQTPKTVTEKGEKRAYSRKQDTSLPDGCILASKFAESHGVKRPTFIDHMNNGLGPGLIGMSTDTIPKRDRVDYSERPKPNRPNEKERYLTSNQQKAALEFWKRHDVTYTECNDIGCWCHAVKNGEE